MNKPSYEDLLDLAKSVVRCACWDLHEMDGADIQEHALKVGLLVKCAPNCPEWPKCGCEEPDRGYIFFDRKGDSE